MDTITALRRMDAAIDNYSEYVEGAAGIITAVSDHGDGSASGTLEFFGQRYHITLTPLED